MSASASTRKERFLPYRYRKNGLSMHVARVLVDGTPRLEELDPDRRLIELEDGFESATVALELTAPGDTLDAVLPESERSSPPVRFSVVLRCHETRVRRGISVELPRDGAQAHCEIPLRRSELFGSAEIHAFLVRTVPGQGPAGWARHDGARLAATRPWELRFDRRRSPVGSHLDIRYKSFRSDPLIRPEHQGNLYLLETERESPILWLNADQSEVADVLDTRASTGLHARLRDAVFERIAAAVWPQLFVRALREWGDEAVEDEPASDWQAGILDQLLDDLYPERSSRAERWHRLRYERDDVAGLLERLDAALQIRGHLVGQLGKLIEETTR